MDAHCEKILREYHELAPVYQVIQEIADDFLGTLLKKNDIHVTAFESRIKTEKSLSGKLELKGLKYHSIRDITDILGFRVITLFSDEVDKVAALIESEMDIDWENSVDKRSLNDISSFGYMSLHYICRIPKSLYYYEAHPEINELRFELQIRTALQHVWAAVYHDWGYKSELDIPKEYMRRISCLAGILELADREFLAFRSYVDDHEREMRSLLNDGRLDEVELSTESFRSYLKLEPFDLLTKKIALVNHAEITPTELLPYCFALQKLGLKTLGDLQKLIDDYSTDAYNLARYQLGNSEYDIVSSSIGIASLCQVYIIRNGGGEEKLLKYYESLYGKRESNHATAERILAVAKKINIV